MNLLITFIEGLRSMLDAPELETLDFDETGVGAAEFTVVDEPAAGCFCFVDVS